MNITVYAKKRQSKDQRIFYTYLTTLTNKTTGEKIHAQVKFRADCNTVRPEECPCNIVIDKGDGNLSEKRFTRQEVDELTGEIRTIESSRYELWVSAWTPGEAFEDHSLDDYD